MSEQKKEWYLIHDARTGMKLGEVEAETPAHGAAVFAEHHGAKEVAEADDYPGVYKMKRGDGKVAYFKLTVKGTPATIAPAKA